MFQNPSFLLCKGTLSPQYGVCISYLGLFYTYYSLIFFKNILSSGLIHVDIILGRSAFPSVPKIWKGKLWRTFIFLSLNSHLLNKFWTQESLCYVLLSIYVHSYVTLVVHAIWRSGNLLYDFFKVNMALVKNFCYLYSLLQMMKIKVLLVKKIGFYRLPTFK